MTPKETELLITLSSKILALEKLLITKEQRKAFEASFKDYRQLFETGVENVMAKHKQSLSPEEE